MYSTRFKKKTPVPATNHSAPCYPSTWWPGKLRNSTRSTPKPSGRCEFAVGPSIGSSSQSLRNAPGPSGSTKMGHGKKKTYFPLQSPHNWVNIFPY